MRKITPESPKEAYGDMGMMGAKAQDKKFILPTTCFDNKTLPEAKDWQVGKTYRVTLDLEMTGISNRMGQDGMERGHFDFNVVGVDAQGVAPAEKKGGKPARYSGAGSD